MASVNPAPDSDSSRLGRHTLYQGASTVEELVAMVPSDYRHVLRDPLLGIAATTTKLLAGRTTLTKWRAHQLASPKTYPSFIRAKAPEIQLTKEFGSSDEALLHKKNLLEAYAKFLDDSLQKCIQAKADDVKFLEASIKLDRLFNELRPLVKQRGDELVKSSMIPTWKEGSEKGELVLGDWVPNPVSIKIYREVEQDCAVFAHRIISIVEAREYAVKAKLEKKKTLASDADVEMGDATAPGPSIQKMVADAVSAQLKKKTAGPKVRRKTIPSDHSNRPLYSETGRKGQQEGHFFNKQIRQAASSSHALRPKGWPEAPESYSRREVHQEQGWQGEGFKGEGQGQGLDALILDASFRYDVPSTYPDWLLTVPYRYAISRIILNVPIHVLSASQFKSHVHKSPGVIIPLAMEHQLSVGMNYLFSSPRNTKLIKDAWKDFESRLRWRLQYSFTEGLESDYDPDYEVPHVSTARPPVLPAYLEHGIELGRRFVIDTIAKIPEDTETGALNTLAPSPRRVKEFLLSNAYIVTNTDKNLGIAVSKREWIIERCLNLLSSKTDYKELNPITAFQVIDKKCTDMEEVALLADYYLDNGPQVGKFLRSKITPPKSKHVVPVFYGIPKIHKEPVKMRPIIPCHSAVQNPAAKYVSKILKPIIKSAPTIIHGSKDLAIKLSKLKMTPNRKFYIVTGDVVAFYPNIPIQKCIDVVADLYYEFYHNNADPADQSQDELRQAEIFLKCLNVGNRDLILQYQNKLYLQLRGLAMGVADSPDLANLFGFYFERKVGVLDQPNIPFYGRYIDDCIALVYASSEQEALQALSIVKFDGCTIEWNVSDQYQPFLDMTIYRDEFGKLQHMPYRKARSHQERIPWISHHPFDVKRGTFIGELSRLATLCSRKSDYIESVKGLVALYMKRGYPQNVVTTWVQKHCQERWEKRLNEIKPDVADVLVLKSEFNTAWNYFSATELGNIILTYWRDWIIRAELPEATPSLRFPLFTGNLAGLRGVRSDLMAEVRAPGGGTVMVPDIRKINMLNRRMIVSRKRTRNLFDLTSLWKKIVLLNMEQQVLQEMHKEQEPQDNIIPDSDIKMNDPVSPSSSDSNPRTNFEAVLGTIGWLS